MFKIIKASDGTVLALTEDVTYIKKADNGCYILCPESEDYWLWARAFFDAPIFDLQAIAALVQ